MEKIKVNKQVIETKQVTVYKAFDGKEFETEKDCLNYEQLKFDKIGFEKLFNISKIEDYDVIEYILSATHYSSNDYWVSIYKINIPTNYWDEDFDEKEFLKYFKLYFEVGDDIVITQVGEIFFIKSFDYQDDEYFYEFLSKEDLINEFNKRIETIKNL